MKKKNCFISGFVSGLAPVVALAQNVGTAPTACATNITKIQDLLCKISELLNVVLPVFVALGVVYFVWGVVSYVISSDEEAKKTGRNRIIYGIIGLAVIIGVWGLVNLLRNTFNLNNQQVITLPTVPY